MKQRLSIDCVLLVVSVHWFGVHIVKYNLIINRDIVKEI